LISENKGMKRVLQERGRNGFKKQCGVSKLHEDIEVEAQNTALLELDRCERGKDCCALRILENQPDFLNEKS
jgi:hypothetical protein